MANNTCPHCGGPLQPPDDFCQRCHDAEMKVRQQSTWGFPESTPWYRTSVPFLAIALVLLVVQVGLFELVTRPAWKKQLARAQAVVQADQDRAAECEALSNKAADWQERSQLQCQGFTNWQRIEQNVKRLDEFKAVPTTFYCALGMSGLLLLLLTLWARRRPLPASVLAAVVIVVAIGYMALSEVSVDGSLPPKVTMGVVLVATVVAALHSITGARD